LNQNQESEKNRARLNINGRNGTQHSDTDTMLSVLAPIIGVSTQTKDRVRLFSLILKLTKTDHTRLGRKGLLRTHTLAYKEMIVNNESGLL
jgi:hypothetical protein